MTRSIFLINLTENTNLKHLHLIGRNYLAVGDFLANDNVIGEMARTLKKP